MDFPEGFAAAPRLAGGVLRLDPLTEADVAPLFAAASDPKIWEQHPAPDRYQWAVFEPYAAALLKGGGTLVARDMEGQVVGCSRFYPASDVPGSVSIGFTFLVRALWGGAANRAMKDLMLTHAFQWVEEVWFHIGPDNLRSQKATEKLGAVFSHQAEIDLGTAKSPMVCYRLKKPVWEETRA